MAYEVRICRRLILPSYQPSQRILGIEMAPPIAGVSRQKKISMLLYSLYAWQYRFFLYFGIATLVYLKFTKVVGVIMFIVEIVIFLLGPLIKEVKVLWSLKSKITINPLLVGILLSVLLLLSWFIVPISRRVSIPGIIKKDSYCRVSVIPESSGYGSICLGQRGTVQLKTEPRSLAWQLLKYVYFSLIRQSGL